MKVSLNGRWNFEPIERQTLYDDGVKTSVDNLPQGGEIEIPQNWELAGLNDFNGRVRFSRTFDLEEIPDDKRAFLIFQGVDYSATVYLNGRLMGHHDGYFQKFSFEVTDFLKEANEIEVAVDCPMEDPDSLWPDNKVLLKGVFNHHDARPGGWSKEVGQSKSSGGIWGNVYLEFVPQSFIERTKVRSTVLESGGAWITAEITVNSLQRAESVIGISFDGNSETRAVTVMPGSYTYQISIFKEEPELWWTWDLGTPYLYEAEMYVRTAEEHRIQECIGIRSVHYNPQTGEWKLNGKRLFLRGTNIIPTQWLSSYTGDVIAKDIELMRNANVNAARVHAHVNRQEFYDACDKVGILVWQDFALQWSYKENNDVLTSAVSQITDMVVQFYNHPCIMTWCCHNEPSHNAGSMDEVLSETVRGLDGTRHVHTQSDFAEHPYWGWYLDDYKAFHEAPMGPLVTEFGAQAFPNKKIMDVICPSGHLDFKRMEYHNFQWDETVNVANIDITAPAEEVIEASQHYQAELLKYVIEQYRRQRYPKVGALFQFMFVDCWPSISWSVVDVNREVKQGYRALSTAYQPVLPIATFNRFRWLPGRTLSFPVVVVNDTQRVWDGASVLVQLKGTTETIELPKKPVSIPADGSSTIVEMKYDIPADMPAQDINVAIEVLDDDGSIAHNNYPLSISSASPTTNTGPLEALNG